MAKKKAALRSTIAKRLKMLSDEHIKNQSNRVREQLLSSKIIEKSRAISVYLHMPKRELQTDQLLSDLFMLRKEIFIPRVDGMSSTDMRMLRLKSLEEMSTFVPSKWNIKEPTVEHAERMENALDKGSVDTVLVPGVAFDGKCQRLGHGKGYYDCFLRQLQKIRLENKIDCWEDAGVFSSAKVAPYSLTSPVVVGGLLQMLVLWKSS